MRPLPAKRGLRVAFLLLIAVQAAHSVEEYAFALYEVFPPMRTAYSGNPQLARPAFIIFNTALVAAGLFCDWRWVKWGGKPAVVCVLAWVILESANLCIRAIWTIAERGYTPGLLTACLLVPVLLYLITELRACYSAESSGGSDLPR